eukprot:gene42342-27000_t
MAEAVSVTNSLSSDVHPGMGMAMPNLAPSSSAVKRVDDIVRISGELGGVQEERRFIYIPPKSRRMQTRVGLSSRKVSLVCTNVCRYHKSVDAKVAGQTHELCHFHEVLMDAVVDACKPKAVLDTRGHANGSARDVAAHAKRTIGLHGVLCDLGFNDMRLSVGACSGGATFGHVGGATLKVFSVFSTLCGWAQALERLSQQSVAQCVVDALAADRESDQFYVYNNAVCAYLAGKWKVAADLLHSPDAQKAESARQYTVDLCERASGSSAPWKSQLVVLHDAAHIPPSALPSALAAGAPVPSLPLAAGAPVPSLRLPADDTLHTLPVGAASPALG